MHLGENPGEAVWSGFAVDFFEFPSQTELNLYPPSLFFFFFRPCRWGLAAPQPLFRFVTFSFFPPVHTTAWREQYVLAGYSEKCAPALVSKCLHPRCWNNIRDAQMPVHLLSRTLTRTLTHTHTVTHTWTDSCITQHQHVWCASGLLIPGSSELQEDKLHRALKVVGPHLLHTPKPSLGLRPQHLHRWPFQTVMLALGRGCVSKANIQWFILFDCSSTSSQLNRSASGKDKAAARTRGRCCECPH